jgi:hypothetical protein
MSRILVINNEVRRAGNAWTPEPVQGACLCQDRRVYGADCSDV